MTSSNAATAPTGLSASERVQVAHVNGIALHYVDSGNGPTVFLLHGGMGDLWAWPHQIRALTPRYRVVAYSRRRSHPNQNEDTRCRCFANCIDEDIDDLLALQTELHAGPVHLLGTSYGALLALAVALRTPDRVASLMLAEPPLHRWACATQYGERLYRAFIAGVWSAAADAFRHGLQHRAMQLLIDGMWGRPIFGSWPDERVEAVMRNADAMQALTQAKDPFPEVDRCAVASLTKPTLLLQGEQNSALHRQVMSELGNVMPDATRTDIASAGHGLPNDNPDDFNSAVVAFLESLRHSKGDSR